MKKIALLLLATLFFVQCGTKTSDHCLRQVPELKTLPGSGITNFPESSPPDAYYACLLQIFEGQRLKNPADFDGEYRQILAKHKEGDGLFYALLRSADGPTPPLSLLANLKSTPEYDLYWLKEQTGYVAENEEFDILFTLSKKGKLVDCLVIGAGGINYLRNFTFSEPEKFEIAEFLGREEEQEPAYRATFRIETNGTFMLEKSMLDQSTLADQANEAEDQGGSCYTSLIELATGKTTVAAFKEALFSDGELIEDTVFVFSARADEYLIALGISGVADRTLFIAKATGSISEENKAAYQLNSCQIFFPSRSDFFWAELKGLELAGKGTGWVVEVGLETIWAGTGEGQPKNRRELQTFKFNFSPDQGLKLLP